MKSPKISIVIPSYNKVKYIDQTLKSIFDQSYKNFEVIIQDGGSIDGSLEIIKKYAKKYETKLFWVSKKDKGQLDAINKGFKKANGEILTFINADDVYTEGTFKTVVDYYLGNPNTLWFVGKGIVIDEDSNEIVKLATMYKSFLLSFNLYSLLLVTNYIMQPSVFITEEAVKKYDLFTGTKFAVMEYDLWLKIGKNQMPVIINKILSKFRMEKDTKTSVNSKILLKVDEIILKKYTKNIVIIFLHKINNLGRKVVLNIIQTIQNSDNL